METDQDRLAERRRHLAGIADDFRAHDQIALTHLAPGQLADQLQARQLLHNHIRAVWEQAKAAGLDPAITPEWTSVAMLCDLTGDLWSTASNVQARSQPHRP